MSVATPRNAAAIATRPPSSSATTPTAAAQTIPLTASIAVTTTLRTWSWKTTLSVLSTAIGRVAQTSTAAIRIAESSASARHTPSDSNVTGPIRASRSVSSAPNQCGERSGSPAARSTATWARPRLPK